MSPWFSLRTVWCTPYHLSSTNLPLHTCISCPCWSVCGVHPITFLPQLTCIFCPCWSVWGVHLITCLPICLSIPVFPAYAGQCVVYILSSAYQSISKYLHFLSMVVSVWNIPYLLPTNPPPHTCISCPCWSVCSLHLIKCLPIYLCIPVFPVRAGQCVEYTSPPAYLCI